ncbi:10647_t:CDS:2, partial [Funneliformis geosporum]
MDRASPLTLCYLGSMLKGRPQNCAVFIKFDLSKTLGPQINPEKVIVNIRVFYTTNYQHYQHAIRLLQYEIFPTKSSDSIALIPQDDSYETTVQINLEF